MRLPYIFLVLGLALPVAAQDQKLIERGRYLVDEVAKCGECHTPRAENGQPDKAKHLKGAVLDFMPIGTPPPGWHKTSPDLTPAGRLWSKWGEATILKYFETGLAQNGKPADPPMPAYKFTKPDAEAVLAYLKSLK